MNFVKKSSLRERTKDGVGTTGGVKVLIRALSLPILDYLAGPWQASLFCFLIRLHERLTQGLRGAKVFRAIAKDRSLIVTYPNWLTHLLYIKFLKL